MWCTSYGTFMLCVVSTVITIVVSANLGMHNKIPMVSGTFHHHDKDCL